MIDHGRETPCGPYFPLGWISHNHKNNFKEVNDQLNTENMPCILLQRKAFLYLMNISIP